MAQTMSKYRNRGPGVRRARPGRRGLRLLAVAAAAVALPATLVVPAHADGPGDPMGKTVQFMPPAEVLGGAQAVDFSFGVSIQLSTGFQGPGYASLTIPASQMPAGVTTGELAAHLHSWCSVDGGQHDQVCVWHGGAAGEPLQLQWPQAPDGRTTFSVSLSADSGSLPADRLLTGTFDERDTGGTLVATGPASIQYYSDLEPPTARGMIYARDTSGRLWGFEGKPYTPSDPYKAPFLIGAGWNAYTAITPLISPTAGATGDLVARDKDGVLWYYQHSGKLAQPWKPRVKVGAGWNIYDKIVGAGGTLADLANGKPGDLVARDSAGILWRYAATGNPARPFYVRTKIGAGWNAFGKIVTYGDGILAVDNYGALWSYSLNHKYYGGLYNLPVKVGYGWTYRMIAGTWAGDSAGDPALIAAGAGPQAYFYPLKPGAPQVPGQRILITDGRDWDLGTHWTAVF